MTKRMAFVAAVALVLGAPAVWVHEGRHPTNRRPLTIRP